MSNSNSNPQYINQIVAEEVLNQRFKDFITDCPNDMFGLLDQAIQSFLIVEADGQTPEHLIRKRNDLNKLRYVFRDEAIDNTTQIHIG